MSSEPHRPPLEGRVVLITGASSGIGAATARTLSERGARVVLGARRGDRLRSLVDAIGSERAVGQVTDVTDPASIAGLVDLGLERFGMLDTVFCNAGLGGGGSIVDGDAQRWRDILLTNVYGVALTMRGTLTPLLAAERGHVVVTASLAGRKVSHNHMYSASKFAIEAIGEGLRQDLRGRVRVTLVAPGMVETELALWPEKVLQAEDVARTIAFCLEQPPDVAINHVSLRDRNQEF